ncbi:site-specific recombinase [Listeria riparia FSL S10-1204]|uniref:Site-specific recombinase n=1 Tax=Listeria riparia FSL S10-1204 TaxID=1265816 RepID=W7D146_9LIST|nr:site-specific recombinase [Listeria riparia FSL S10-1204]
MKVAYARVSSTDQNLDRQLEEFKSHGAEKIFVEEKNLAPIILIGKNFEKRWILFAKVIF